MPDSNASTPNRVTTERIKSRIAKELYFTGGAPFEYPRTIVPDSVKTMTFCILVLDNGWTQLGTSNCVDPANFDEEIGRKWAYEDAFNKLWPLEGYLLKEKMVGS